jgi:hypothetical protein
MTLKKTPKKLQNLYPPLIIVGTVISKKTRWAGHAARMGKTTNAYRNLVVKPEGKRPLRRPSRRWQDNTEIDITETGWEVLGWIT